MIEWIRFGFAALFMTFGLLSFIIGIFGFYKFGFVLNRMHSAAIIDTCGILFIVIGLVISRGFVQTNIKLLMIVGFLWLTSPIASHLIAKMEFFTDRSVGGEIENDINKVRGDSENEYRDL